MQVYSIILWAKPYKKNYDFEKIAKLGFNILQELKNFGDELHPKYLTVKNKKDATPLLGTYEEFKDLLKRNVNKEGKSIFQALGYNISFFSSLVNSESASIRLHIGVTHPSFKNTLILNLPEHMDLKNETKLNQIEILFKRLIELFNPFWACFENTQNSLKFDALWHNNLPTTIHWLNYFNYEITNIIGEKRIKMIDVLIKEKYQNGYYIKLSKFPIDVNSKSDISLQDKNNNILKFVQ